MPYHHLSEPLQALKKKTNRSTAAIPSSGWARSPLGAADRVSANPAGAAQLPGPGPARCPEPQRLAGDKPGDTPEPAKGRVPSRAASPAGPPWRARKGRRRFWYLVGRGPRREHRSSDPHCVTRRRCTGNGWKAPPRRQRRRAGAQRPTGT